MSLDVFTSFFIYSDGGLVVPVSTAYSPGRGTKKWGGQSRIQKTVVKIVMTHSDFGHKLSSLFPMITDILVIEIIPWSQEE